MEQYFAGILDGEGCIGIHRTAKRSFTPRVQVGMSDRRVLDLLCNQYGGSIQFHRSKNPRHKDSWMWYACSSAAERVLRAVLPYLIIKKQQALITLELAESVKSKPHIVPGKKGVQPIPPDVMAYRESLKAKIHILNQTGPRI